MKRNGKLYYGFGINDADYVTSWIVNGKRRSCPFYQTWGGMIERCYSLKWLEKYPSYRGCSVGEEWRSFMAFRAWMIHQDHINHCLDKDLLVQGNRVYSPETCIFIPQAINKFMTDGGAARGAHLIGVHLKKGTRRYAAQISRGAKSRIHLGYFATEIEAHLAWAYAKRNIAYELATEQTDERVSQALRNFGEMVVSRAESLLLADCSPSSTSS